jgi:hypothetical protein
MLIKHLMLLRARQRPHQYILQRQYRRKPFAMVLVLRYRRVLMPQRRRGCALGRDVEDGHLTHGLGEELVFRKRLLGTRRRMFIRGDSFQYAAK